VGADQILVVGPSPEVGIDFSYRIFNADGGEVQHCGNGARCFVRYVRERGLAHKTSIRVRTVNADLTLTENPGGDVTVNMGVPSFKPAQLPFDDAGLPSNELEYQQIFGLDASDATFADDLEEYQAIVHLSMRSDATLNIAVASMGNPHAVMWVNAMPTEFVHAVGAWLRAHARFAQGVNVGFMDVVSRTAIKLRVFERGVGETLACGTGACAAVACGVQMGLLDAGADVSVQTRGGQLRVNWAGPGADLFMTGPAQTVFSAQVEVPDNPTLPLEFE
jgi:diaminopimelate epimerase